MAKNPRYTQRFAMHVGKLCRDMLNKTVAEMGRSHHSTVNDLDELCMQNRADLARLPAPRAIGIDKSPSAMDITTGLSSMTWTGGALSGTELKAARRLTLTFFQYVAFEQEHANRTSGHGHAKAVLEFDHE